MNAPVSANKIYPYGPKMLLFYMALVFSGGCAYTGHLMTLDNDPEGPIVMYLSLFCFFGPCIGGILFFSRPRYITLNPVGFSAPAGRLSLKRVEIGYADLIDVQKMSDASDPCLLVTHRAGKLALPLVMLGRLDIDELQRDLLSRIKAARPAPSTLT
ncbi:hypothetical protein P0Y43_19580 [Pseudomonas entomophila]|uniref:hypothetical protein n=1 Tax=Pseudomonas entomophila TaxID=312306 RepID=UPI0023D830A2|nr:hypothetical protein [Pseudomonas entomophila]MDF0732896.1 hypothetical protein [Pseudomonas entomophila]